MEWCLCDLRHEATQGDFGRFQPKSVSREQEVTWGIGAGSWRSADDSFTFLTNCRGQDLDLLPDRRNGSGMGPHSNA